MIRRYSATDRVQETRTPDTTEFHDIMLVPQWPGIIFNYSVLTDPKVKYTHFLFNNLSTSTQNEPF